MTIRVCLRTAALLAWMALPAGAASPVLAFEVSPAAGGKQLVRQSLPFPKGALAAADAIAVTDGKTTVPAALRTITAHPGAGPASVRRGLVTFLWGFAATATVRFEIHKGPAGGAGPAGAPPRVTPAPDGFAIELDGGATVKARMIAPPPGSPLGPVVESVETGATRHGRRPSKCAPARSAR